MKNKIIEKVKAKAIYGEIRDLKQWNALPEGTNISQSFGYAHTNLYGRKRGDRIVGDIWYINSDTGAWSPDTVNIDINDVDKQGTLHFYMAVE